MSNSQEDDLRLRDIAEGEYQLVDVQQLKEEIRNSTIALLQGDSPLDPPSPISSPTHSAQPNNLNTPHPVQLPITMHKVEQEHSQRQVRSSEDIENNVIGGNGRKHFSVQNRKQIEDVMYQEVGGQNSHLAKVFEPSENKTKDIYWSRFVPKEISIPPSTPVHLLQTSPRAVRRVQTSPRATFSHQFSSSPPPLVETMQVVRRVSGQRGQQNFLKQVQAHEGSSGRQDNSLNRSISNSREKNVTSPTIIQRQVVQRASLPSTPQRIINPERPSLPRNINNRVVFVNPRSSQKQSFQDRVNPFSKSYHLAKLRDNKANQLFLSRPRQVLNGVARWQQEQWVTAIQPRMTPVNNSPNKAAKQRYYMNSQNKMDFKLNRTEEQKADYIEQNRLKQEYLEGVEIIRKQINKQVQQLRPSSQFQTPQKKGHYMQQIRQSKTKNKSSQRTRKKIFSSIEVSEVPKVINHIVFEQTSKKPGYLTPKNETTGRITKAMKDRKELSNNVKSKVVNKQIDFDRVKAELTGDRIKIFKSKQKQGVSLSNSPKSKKMNFQRLRLAEMPGQTRKWYQNNSRQILYQVERIGSYDLIRRYMSSEQINSRLNELLLARVEPRRWCLTLVDEVYSKLKDRYLA